MDGLDFYTVSLDYVSCLKEAERKKRGFSRIPNMEYSDKRKPKFLCGIVLQINNSDYYVPVTSYKQQKGDNFLIKATNGLVVGSLRFNYMFPIPKGLISVRRITDEPDLAYRALLSQERRYCIKNQEAIQRSAERTYKRVLLGKDPGLVANSCDFPLLEQKCAEYTAMQKEKLILAKKQPTSKPARLLIEDQVAATRGETDQRPIGHSDTIQQSNKNDPIL